MSDWTHELFDLVQRQYDFSDESPNTFRVSDLLTPASLVARNRQWADKPEHPADGVAAMIGTAVHELVRQGITRYDKPVFQNGVRMREPIEIDGTEYAVTGEPDVLIGNSVVADLKVCKYGTPLKPEWVWQLRLYAWLCHKHYAPIRTAESIGILKLYKNWSPENPRQKSGPWEFEQVEMVSDEAVERFIRYRIGLILKAREGASDCPPNDRWGTVTVRPDGMALVENPKRCQFYCKHRDYCPQWEQEQALGPVAMKPVSFEPPEDWE